MPSYDSLSTQITAIKSEMTTLLSSGQATAQDIVFLAAAIDKMGTMLGVNDIVAATAAGVSTVSSASNDIATARDAAIAVIYNSYLHPLFLMGV